MNEQKWIKPAIGISCLLALLSMAMPWNGSKKSAFQMLFSDWSVGGFFYINYQVPMLLFVISMLTILIYTFAFPKKGFPQNGAVFLSFPFILLLPVLLTSFAGRGSKGAFYDLSIYFLMAIIISFLLSGTGFYLDRFTEKKSIPLPTDSLLKKIRNLLYYTFIFIGVFYACIIWNEQGYMNDRFGVGNYSQLVNSAWLPLGIAALLWLLFSKHQYLRVWFHLIAFYALFAILLNFFLSGETDSTLVFMSGYSAYAIVGAALLSLFIGRKRSCPSCHSIFGKKLISYSKAGSSSYEYNTTKQARVGDIKYGSSGSYNIGYGSKDDDYVSVNVTKTKKLYHYDTQNICKHCGYTWQSSESHQQWWYRPM